MVTNSFGRNEKSVSQAQKDKEESRGRGKGWERHFTAYQDQRTEMQVEKNKPKNKT